jgi:DUF4097 and DUF4098 domain-containing protein YvlB
VILILLGAFLLLGNLHVYGWPMLRHYFAQYWPVLLIIWGLVLLLEHFSARRRGERPSRIGGGAVVLIVVIAIAGLGMEKFEGANWDSLGVDGNVLPQIDLGDGNVLEEVFGQQYTFNQQLEQPIAAEATLNINSDRGAVTVSAWDQNRVRVVVTKKIRAESADAANRADSETQVQLSGSGNDLSLNANTSGAGKRPVQSDLQIFLPAKVAVKIAARGDITVHSRQAGVTISDGRGNVVLEDIAGNANLSARRGDITVTRLTGDVVVDGVVNGISITDVSGSVRLNGGVQDAMHLTHIAQGVSYQSSRTTLRLARLDGDLSLEQGDLKANGVGGPAQLSTRSKDIHLADVAGNLDLQNANGNVEIRLTRLPVGAINITNRHADTHVILPGKAACQVNARTRHGDISSDFHLSTTSTQGGSSASGTIGSGGSTLQIDADYGDIRISKG